MKRFIAIICLLLILITVACTEEIFLHNFISQLSIKSEQVSVLVKENEDNLNVTKLKTSYKELSDFWEKSKTFLCYFTNYEKIRAMDEGFTKLETAITNNDSSLAIENIALIKGYNKVFHYIMGFNINNLF